MKAWCVAVAVCLAAGAGAARAAGGDEGKARDALKTQVSAYLETTRADLKTDQRYPNLAVNLISTTIEPSGSLVTPFTAEVRYVLEYDDPNSKGVRQAHPFLLTSSYFGGRWDIAPHAHREGKNVRDLDPEKSKILFPNI